MRFGILGPLDVTRDGQPVPITAPMQRSVLAVLLLDAGKVVPTDRMMERLWGSRPPSRDRKSVV